LWRKLPGGWPAKLAQSVALAAVIIAVLMIWVFPWVEPQLPFSENTVDGEVSEVTPSPTNPTAQPDPTPGTTSVPSPLPGNVPDTLPGDDTLPGE
jgi:hypothetical protein